MWIMLNDAFLSVVDKSKVRDCLLVRARRREHLLAAFPDADVRESLGTDYRFRADIPRQDIIEELTNRLHDLDYDNFKDSVKDDPLHDAYMGVWSVMGRLQKGGPYSRGDRRGPSLFDDRDARIIR